MSLRLRLTSPSTIPINVEGILPETTDGLAAKDAARIKIRHGNRSVELGDLFEVSTNSNPCQLCWQGNLAAVHWIGNKMTTGEIVIEGNAGRHLGSQMRGGRVVVHGDAGDYLGCEMLGGTICVNGNASDWVCTAYHGNKTGTNGGQVIVSGNAGSAVGMGLRRGTVFIGGNTAELAGWNMLAGTIIIGGQTGTMIGKGMVRGTILLAAENSVVRNNGHLPPTFTKSGLFRPVVVDLIEQWLKRNDLSIHTARSNFQMYHGDHLKGGRGEILMAE